MYVTKQPYESVRTPKYIQKRDFLNSRLGPLDPKTLHRPEYRLKAGLKARPFEKPLGYTDHVRGVSHHFPVCRVFSAEDGRAKIVQANIPVSG